jgi:thiazole synthase
MTTPAASQPAAAASSVATHQKAPPAGASSAASGDEFVLAGRSYRSRLIVGTGKYRDFDEMGRALAASGAEIVTVALRRVELSPGKPSLLSAIDRSRYQLLPNTAGCYTAEDAIRTCRLARELGLSDFVKLEVIGDPRTLFPDVEQTLAAARVLVKEGFVVLPYITDDPIACLRLAEMGCAAVMPLAAPIGSGLGIRNPYNLRIIMETVKVPVIVDAGVGTASDAAVAMELGCDAVLMNTAIAGAQDAVLMAEAMRQAVEAGRKAFRAGRIGRKLYANASSPQSGILPSSASGLPPVGPYDIE